MCAPSACLNVKSESDSLRNAFLAILPKIEKFSRIYFRATRCANKFQDQLAEVIGLCWKWMVRLAERGKDAAQFPVVLASYACRAVKSGRRVCGQLKSKDVMSELAQQRHSFKVEALPISNRTSQENLYSTPHGQQMQDSLEERLHSNCVTPPDVQAGFRIDWPAFFKFQTERDQKLALFLAMGNSNKHAASKFGLSPSRVTQIRQQLCREWKIGQGEAGHGEMTPALA